ELVAILGGSGAGKSTLIGALTGMNPATSGSILINGRDLYHEYEVFRCMMGYVPQDDIVHVDLTVEEVLTYTARLRMPEDTSKEEIKSTVEQVMMEVELTERRDILVKNLSGGQRKRVSIGVELITRPGLFFLDEPTSGLDPGLERIMMELVRKLADQGRTILLVTHATFNIKLCDKVLFLADGGKLAFFGTPAEAIIYFEATDFADIYQKISTEKTPDQWARIFKTSESYKSNVACRDYGINQKINTESDKKSIGKGSAKISSIRQWMILTERFARIMSRDKANLGLLLMQPLIIAALIVMIFYASAPLFNSREYKNEDLIITSQVIASGGFQDIQDKIQSETNRRFNMSICIALMIFSAIWLGTSNSAQVIVKEIPIYQRERLVNLHIAPYLFSKVFVLSVICLIQTAIFIGVITIGLGLPQIVPVFLAFFLVSITSVMMGLTVSAVSSNADKAMTAVPLLLVPQIILAGAIVPMQAIKPAVFQWIFYLAISKWGYELVGGRIIDINRRAALDHPLKALDGIEPLHWMVLAIFAVMFCFLTTLAMIRKDRNFN
ncbi:MAG: ATP-binding cassette domain-containing protein, partial [Deltaproteobacteria bacterium]